MDNIEQMRDSISADISNQGSALMQVLIGLQNSQTDIARRQIMLLESLQKIERNQNERLKLIEDTLTGHQEIRNLLVQVYSALNAQLRSDHTATQLSIGDVLLAPSGIAASTPGVTVVTEYPIASDSNDHKYPWGAANDFTRHPRFVRACEKILGPHLRVVDMGCSGGGIVLDFVLRGHRAIGIEGSDYSLLSQRAAWRLIPEHLFTADIAKPLSVRSTEDDYRKQVQFDVITAWEVLEHLDYDGLLMFFDNVRRHLLPSGVFVGSVTTVNDMVNGIEYHRTVQPRPWWEALFRQCGLIFRPSSGFEVADYCRGVGNGERDPDFSKNPDHGFHFVLQVRQ